MSAYPAASSLTTVTRPATGGGVVPVVALPRLTLDRSSAIESSGWMSMSTVAPGDTPLGGGECATAAIVALDLLRGAGAAEAKSLEFESMSTKPSPARVAAVRLARGGRRPGALEVALRSLADEVGDRATAGQLPPRRRT